MDIKEGDRLKLICEGDTRTGTVTACSQNKRSLLVHLDDGLPANFGMYLDHVPLSLKDDGTYTDLTGAVRVEIAVTQ